MAPIDSKRPRAWWPRMRRAVTGAETGSSVVEFSLVSIVLVTLFLGILQFALVLHVRNTLVACAAEGARTAANADADLALGVARTRELAAQALSSRYAEHVTAALVDGGGVALVEVRVEAPLPLLGLLGPQRRLQAAGHAVEEGT